MSDHGIDGCTKDEGQTLLEKRMALEAGEDSTSVSGRRELSGGHNLRSVTCLAQKGK